MWVTKQKNEVFNTFGTSSKEPFVNYSTEITLLSTYLLTSEVVVLKLEFYTEISTYVFHSQKPADLNFPPKHMRQMSNVLSLKWSDSDLYVGNFGVVFFSL